MKNDLLKLWITTILSFYLGLISAQNTFELIIEDTSTIKRDRISYDVLEVEDGFLLTSIYLGGKEDFALTKIDKQGNVLWDKTFEVGTWTEFKPYIIKTQNKNEYILAFQSFSFQNISLTSTLTVVYKINAKGDILWEKILETSNSIGKMVLLPNNTILIEDRNDGEIHFLYFLSTDGKLQKEVIIEKNEFFIVHGIAIYDNSIYLCGSYDGDTQTSFLDKYDLEGNLIYSTGLFYGDVYHQRIMKIFKKEDEYFFITADRELFQFDPSTGVYNKIDEDFENGINEQDKVQPYQGRVKHFVVTSNNEILAHSEHSVDNNLSPYGRSKGVMIEMYDNEYKLKWFKFYVKGEFLYFRDIIETSDGGLLFLGHYNPFSEDDSPFSLPNKLYVLKTDCEGNKEWSTDACYIPQITALTLFPNPFSDVLKIQIPSLSEKDNYSLALYNQLGQQVVNQKINSKITAINTSSLSKAMYFYKLINHSTTSAEGKVLKN